MLEIETFRDASEYILAGVREELVSMNHSIFSYRKVYGYVAILLMVLVMRWESQKVDAAVHTESIPEESIRLRILANSDAPADQYVKAIVRDAVVETMNSWITEPMSIEQARV